MLFMSAEHVAAMNKLLAGSAAVNEAAARLDRDYVIAYELSKADDTEYWQLRLGPAAVAFGLAPAPSADLVLRGPWRAAVAAARASRLGGPAEPGLQVDGDPTVMQAIGPVFALAQQVATIPVEWPDVEPTDA